MPSTGRAGPTARTHSRGNRPAIIGTSPGKIGTAIAQQHLRSILAFCNSPLMNSVEAYVQFERGLITDDGRVTNESTEQFLRQYMEEFAGFIAQGVYSAAAESVAAVPVHTSLETEGT